MVQNAAFGTEETMFDRDFSGVCGNRELILHIQNEIKNGKLGHAYIIEGERGVGKHEFATSLAAALVCEDKSGKLPCGKCSACKKAASGAHPDIKTVGRGTKASVGVELIRDIRGDASVIPSESEHKIYIIEDAETMTASAQNAFLLTLEEPPKYVTYLLLCTDTKMLLETIISRAPSLRLCPAKRDELEEFIINKKPSSAELRKKSPDLWEELLVSSRGNAGRALALLEGNALNERISEKTEALAFLISMLSGDGDVYLSLSNFKKSKRESIIMMLSDISDALRDMLVFKKTGKTEPLFFTSQKRANERSAPYSARKLSETLLCVTETVNAVSANAQTTSAILKLAVKIKNIK